MESAEWQDYINVLAPGWTRRIRVDNRLQLILTGVGT